MGALPSEPAPAGSSSVFVTFGAQAMTLRKMGRGTFIKNSTFFGMFDGLPRSAPPGAKSTTARLVVALVSTSSSASFVRGTFVITQQAISPTTTEIVSLQTS